MVVLKFLENKEQEDVESEGGIYHHKILSLKMLTTLLSSIYGSLPVRKLLWTFLVYKLGRSDW